MATAKPRGLVPLLWLLLLAIDRAPAQSLPALEPTASRQLASLRAYDQHLQPIQTENFLLLHSADETWGRAITVLLERVRLEFYTAFTSHGFRLTPAAERLTWVCFSRREAFDDYARAADGRPMPWLTEYYSSRTDRVTLVRERPPYQPAVVEPPLEGVYAAAFSPETGPASGISLTRTTHEAAHQLAFNSGLQRRGVMYPFWVSEGLATSFESDEQGRPGLGTLNPSRVRRLSEAWTSRRLLPLDEFICVVQPRTAHAEVLNDRYAQAWGLFHFLLTEHPQELRSFLERFGARAPGRRPKHELRECFISAFGPMETLSAEWERFLALVSR